MSILVEHGIIGLAEADHRIANNLASLSGVIRLQRNAIFKSGKTFTAGQGCVLLDDINARVEVTADGVGFPESFDPSTDGGLGFQLMRALANGLNAELHFEHNSLGVCARLVKLGRLAS